MEKPDINTRTVQPITADWTMAIHCYRVCLVALFVISNRHWTRLLESSMTLWETNYTGYPSNNVSNTGSVDGVQGFKWLLQSTSSNIVDMCTPPSMAFAVAGQSTWNTLPTTIREFQSIEQLKFDLKIYGLEFFNNLLPKTPMTVSYKDNYVKCLLVIV